MGYFPPIAGRAGFGQVTLNLYDPLGWFNEDKDKVRGRQVEINNGRLAMLGVFFPRPKYLAPSHRSRGSFLHTLVIAWFHSKVTSASALFCHKGLHSPEGLSLAPGAEASKYRRTMVEHMQVYLFHGLSAFFCYLILGD